jgi:pimeloyl-ACP methyl ester carboxylesterase
MSMQQLSAVVEGRTVSGFLHSPAKSSANNPVLIALHGGTYTGEYFCIAGGPDGSFVDIAIRNGFSVLRIDRPGYARSDLLPEAENTFARQAELLEAAIATMLDDRRNLSAVLVGQSIGGIVALEVAARQPKWLIGVAVSGMGARIPAGGAAEQLAAIPLTGVVDLPVEEREQLWYGPPSSVTDDAVAAARSSFAPAPMVELKAAPQWAAQRLNDVGAAIAVPIHHTLGEFDALWDTSPDARELFLSKFNPALAVRSEFMPGVGHCIDHHRAGAAMHYTQLAFAHQCMIHQTAAHQL